MAMTCGSCGYYTEQVEDACPNCKAKLRMTFLPHDTALAEQIAVPDALAPGAWSFTTADQRGTPSLVSMVRRNRLLVGLIGLSLVLFGFRYIGQTQGSGPQTKYAAIREGMTADQVHDILFPNSRFRHDTRIVSNSGDSQMRWTQGPINITVNFRNGKVVSKQMAGCDVPCDGSDARASSRRQ